MKSPAILLFLAAALGSQLVAAQTTNTTRLAAAEEKKFREIALQYLTERYPNVEPSRFVYQNMMLTYSAGQSEGEMTAMFADRDSRRHFVGKPKIKEKTILVTYGTQYLVRLKLDGELISIQQHERSDGILKITPGPDTPVRRPSLTPQNVHTNTIVIIRPESVPQSP
ncbi:MAG: hypothetical protein ABSA97_01230 [Verrucomicrobiia bacterium]